MVESKIPAVQTREETVKHQVRDDSGEVLWECPYPSLDERIGRESCKRTELACRLPKFQVLGARRGASLPGGLALPGATTQAAPHCGLQVEGMTIPPRSWVPLRADSGGTQQLYLLTAQA